MIAEEVENFLYFVGNRIENFVCLEVNLIILITFSLYNWFAITVQ